MTNNLFKLTLLEAYTCDLSRFGQHNPLNPTTTPLNLTYSVVYPDDGDDEEAV